jgi:hypothetical protein
VARGAVVGVGAHSEAAAAALHRRGDGHSVHAVVKEAAAGVHDAVNCVVGEGPTQQGAPEGGHPSEAGSESVGSNMPRSMPR